MDLVRKNIQSLKSYTAGRSSEDVKEAYSLSRVIKLGSNENPLGTSPRALEVMKQALNDVSVYPDGACGELTAALSEHYQFPRDFFIPGNGSDEIFLMIAAAYINPGETVLLSENTFSTYQCSAQIFNGTAEYIPLKNYSYDLEAFAQRMDANVKMVFLCNPNNPTGTYVTQSELNVFLQAAPQSCMVVVDEAYSEFADAKDFPEFGQLLRQHANLIICRTFSKIYGLAGIRLGYAVATPEIIRDLRKVQNFNPFNVNRMAQAGAVAALRDRKFFKETRQLTIKGRKFLADAFDSMGIEHLPSQANFVCFKTAVPLLELAEKMARQGVIIRALKSFGLDDWCRVTVGTQEQNEEFLSTLKSIL
jgi:histidinol-phosphate aminotransferase